MLPVSIDSNGVKVVGISFLQTSHLLSLTLITSFIKDLVVDSMMLLVWPQSLPIHTNPSFVISSVVIFVGTPLSITLYTFANGDE